MPFFKVIVSKNSLVIMYQGKVSSFVSCIISQRNKKALIKKDISFKRLWCFEENLNPVIFEMFF